MKAQRGLDGGLQLAAGAALPPLVLDDEEAVALGVGLQTAIQGGGVVGIEDSSVRALAKIVQVMPSRLRRRVDALAAMTVSAPWSDPASNIDPGDLTSIAHACRGIERLEFGYTARDGARADRRVEPYRLVLLGRALVPGRVGHEPLRLAQLPSRPPDRAPAHRGTVRGPGATGR